MTLFEYVAAGYVLILSLGVLRAVAGVPYAVRSDRRYWVHLAYLFIALILCSVSFWGFWFYRGVEWTYFKFIGALAVPVLWYVYISLLVPPDPSGVQSWRDHFFEVRIPLFATGILAFVAVGISNQAVLGVPSLHFSESSVYVPIAIYAVGLFSAKPKLHAGLALAFTCLALFILFFILAREDPFAPWAP